MGTQIRLRDHYYLRKEIEDLIDQSIEESKRKVTKETTTKQQILILHYLGFIEKIEAPDTTKKAELISKLINRHEQNIREPLTYIDTIRIHESDIKTVSNLKAVRKIFEDCNMKKEIALIDKDLKDLNVID